MWKHSSLGFSWDFMHVSFLFSHLLLLPVFFLQGPWRTFSIYPVCSFPILLNEISLPLVAIVNTSLLPNQSMHSSPQNQTNAQWRCIKCPWRMPPLPSLLWALTGQHPNTARRQKSHRSEEPVCWRVGLTQRFTIELRTGELGKTENGIQF